MLPPTIFTYNIIIKSKVLVKRYCISFFRGKGKYQFRFSFWDRKIWFWYYYESFWFSKLWISSVVEKRFDAYSNGSDLESLQKILDEAKQYSFLENSDVANIQFFLNLRGQLNSGKLGIEEFIKCVDSFAASIHYHIDF